jgi:spermidine synthase
MSGVVFTQRIPTEHLWLLYYDLPRTALTIRNIELPILFTFILTTLSFIPLGQIVAERIQAYREQGNPLMGYVFDLVGSLVGVIAFSVFSVSGIRPQYWFGMLAVVGAAFFLRKRGGVIVYVALLVILLGLICRMDKTDAYSPYYSLKRIPIEGTKGFNVLTNGSLHQVALDMALATQKVSSFNALAREGYHVPFSLLEPGKRTALVLGAGTGNDVATLLDENFAEIDAVEIDPVILKWGKMHPNAPYDSQRVTAITTDARSYLNNCKKKYDLIVFGTLDSQTRLSALSSVRLDNFVYTQETIHAAKKLLTPDGGIVMCFMVGSDYIGTRIAGMLTEAFGEVPLIHSRHHMLFNMAFMAGKAFEKHHAPDFDAQNDLFKKYVLPKLELPSDDWPFLYLETRNVGQFYLLIMAAIAVLSLVGVLICSKTFRTSFGKKGFMDGEMFLFGLAFLLMETRSVTALNLIWGATWLTSAVVFGSVLLMVLSATLLSKERPISFRVSFIGLVISLLAAYGIPVSLGLGNGVEIRLLFSVLTVGTPIFFSSLCFASMFIMRTNADLAFGWNLLGAVCGGLLEFLSMAVGLRALLLIALAAYLMAMLLWMRSQSKSDRSISC